MNIIDNLKERLVRENILERKDAFPILKDEIKNIMNDNITSRDLKLEPSPAILLVVGVNGVGKTTTIGKLSYQFRQEGKSVLIAAADTVYVCSISPLNSLKNGLIEQTLTSSLMKNQLTQQVSFLMLSWRLRQERLIYLSATQQVDFITSKT